MLSSDIEKFPAKMSYGFCLHQWQQVNADVKPNLIG